MKTKEHFITFRINLDDKLALIKLAQSQNLTLSKLIEVEMLNVLAQSKTKKKTA